MMLLGNTHLNVIAVLPAKKLPFLAIADRFYARLCKNHDISF
jgi:hypothetical protein